MILRISHPVFLWIAGTLGLAATPAGVAAAEAAPVIAVDNVRCEYRVNPMGLEANPGNRWQKAQA